MNIKCTFKLTDYIKLFKFINENEAKHLLDERLQNVWYVFHKSGFPYHLEPDVVDYYEKCYVQIEQAMNDQKWDYFIEKLLVMSYLSVIEKKANDSILNTILMHTSFKGAVRAHHLCDIWFDFVDNYFEKYFECEKNKVTYLRRVIAKCCLLCLRNDVPIEDINNKYLTYTHKQLKILEKKQSIEQDFV